MKRNLIILSIIFLQSINGFAQNKIKSITYNVNDCINAYYKSQLWKDIHPKITDVDFEVSQYNASDVHSWGGQDVFAIPIAIKITGIKFIDGNNQSVYLNYNEMQIISGGNWYGMVSGSGIFINTALGNTEKSRSFNIKTAIDGSGRERIEIELKGWSEFISASAPKLKAQGITPTLEKRYEYLNSKLVSDNLSFEIEQNTKEKLKTIIDNYLEKQNSNNQSNYSTYYSEGRQKELAGDYRGAIAAYKKAMDIKRVYEVQQRINECHKKIDEETERNNRKSYNQEQQQGYSSVTIPRTNYSSNEAHYYSGNNNSNNYSANQQNATNNKQKQMEEVNRFINQQNKEIEQMNKTINDAFKPLSDAINAHYEAKIAELDRLEAMHEQYLKDLKNLEKIFEEQIEDMFRSKKYRLNEDIRNALYRQDYEYFKAWYDYYRDYEDLNEDWYNYNKQTIQNKDRQVSSRIHNYNFKNSYRYDEPERTEPRKPDVEMANPNYFNAEDWYDAAVFNKEKRRNEKAIDFIKLALNKKPENIKYNLYLAYLYQSGKNTDDAIETYQFVLSIAPENEKALQNLRYLNYQQGLKYYNSKNYNQAKEYLGDYKLYGGNNLDVDLMYYTSIMHSDTNFSDYAKMKIDEIENQKIEEELDLFNQAKKTNSVDAYNVYLKKYPKGKYYDEALANAENIYVDAILSKLMTPNNISHSVIKEQFKKVKDVYKGRIVDKCRNLALEDNATAQYVLGSFYNLGLGVEKDLKEAVKWYQKSAELDYAPSKNNLGVMYQYGYGIDKNYPEAIKYYTKAAEQVNNLAQLNLGNCYFFGEGVEKNYSEAVKWYRKSAEQGNAFAQRNLGNCYFFGEGVEKNYSEAVKWYRKSAEQGNANAQYYLGDCYYDGKGVDKNYSEAVKWYSKSAEQGSVYAQYYLGDCYYDGKGVDKNYSEAVKWHRKSAEQGFAKAQNMLGMSYYKGEGVNKNYSEAAKWFRKASEQGFAKAQDNLGNMYYQGKGVSKNYYEAFNLFKKAAEQGDKGAQRNLSFMYKKGLGVKKSRKMAKYWEKKADGK